MFARVEWHHEQQAIMKTKATILTPALVAGRQHFPRSNRILCCIMSVQTAGTGKTQEI
jgi:hypothetical protein